MAIKDYIDDRCFEPAEPSGWLTPAQADEYNEQGWIVLPGHVPQDTLDALRPHADDLLEGNHRSCKDIDQRHPVFDDFYRSDKVKGTAERFNGPSKLLQSFAFCKLPGEQRTKPWHQDGVYWGLNNSRVLAIFVALTGMTKDNGCIWCIPGTHKLGRIYHEAKTDEFGLQNLVCDISAFRDPVPIEVAPGDAIVAHTLTVHGSFENNADSPRINLGFHFYSTTTDVKLLAPYRGKWAAAAAAAEHPA